MPRGGKRANAGRKGLIFEEKLQCSALVYELIERDKERRYDRAFALKARSSHREGHPTPELDELKDHLAEIKRPSPEVWKRMTPEERAEAIADRRDYVAQHRAAPDGTPIGALFAATGMSRHTSVGPPTDRELGAIYRHAAEVMTARLERPITHRQVAEARRYIRKIGLGD